MYLLNSIFPEATYLLQGGWAFDCSKIVSARFIRVQGVYQNQPARVIGGR
jgi:hypothetical protein